MAQLDRGAAARCIVRGRWWVGWVADGAVASTERGARPLLALRNGLRVPVSKSFRDQVKEAGWLDK